MTDRHQDRHKGVEQLTAGATTAMEPLLPDRQNPRLAELSRDIFHEAGALSLAISAEQTRTAMATLVREMNSYYSNLIEGHKTLPRDIERALDEDISSDAKAKENQHLAVAHIKVESEMVDRLAQEAGTDIHSTDFLCGLHASFYTKLPEPFRFAKTTSGKEYRVDAGKLRTFDVDVGRHTPPHHAGLPVLMERFRAFYGSPGILATDLLVAAAAAHHRLTWIHPFGDGNGRVARLYSHAALIRSGVGGLGLWTLSRGLARARREYFERLAAADAPRRTDYDGRGNLSAAALTEFCDFFLGTMLDQIRFMGALLGLPKLLARMEDYVWREATDITKHKPQLCRLLKAVASEGQVARGHVPDIVGLKPSAARQVTKLGLEQGLLKTASPKGPLSIAFPAKVLDAYFPRLFLDLPVEE